MIASAEYSAVHDSARPAPVGTGVRRAWRVLVLRRAFESAAIALAALGTCLAAALYSGADPLHPHAWIASCVAGSLASSSWWLEHAAPEAVVARRLDRTASQQGALVTAFECERRGITTGVQELLSLRVARDLALHGPLNVATMSALSILAAPVAAGALLALALESGPSQSARAIAARALTDNARALVAAVEQDRETLPSGVSEEVRALARSIAAATSTQAAAPTLADIESRARALAQRLSERGHVRPALEETVAQASALVAALARGSPGAGSGGAGGRPATAGDRQLPPSLGAALDPAPDGEPAIDGLGSVASADGDSRTGVAAGAPDGTMPRNDPDQPHAPAPDPAAASASELGLSAVRWWPRRFDVIVERWVERERGSNDR